MSQSNYFPKGFYFGTATASYQIEGAVADDGRGPTIWDTFSHTPGKIQDGSNGDVACNHYYQFLQDIELLEELGLNAYRFSVAWSRIFPQGKGRPDKRGLDFYERLVDALLDRGIEPFVTLYHWDLPQALQDKGGWENRDTAYYFQDYAGTIAYHLGDRVKHWITHNEPWVAAFLGNYTGDHAPGLRNMRVALQVAHHLMLSHGLAVSTLRKTVSERTKIGITLNLGPIYPGTDKPEDMDAAYRWDGALNRWFLEPLLKGHYPQDVAQYYGNDCPLMEEEDLHIIHVPLDFVGINYYSRNIVVHDPRNPWMKMAHQTCSTSEYTDMGWEVYPDGLYQLIKRLSEEYQVKELYITENGAAYKDEISKDGRVHDPQRVKYLQAHFEQAERALQDGLPLKGYFVWSLMDNFEWAFGYTKRFGIIYTDYLTQKRIFKDSARWYQDFVKTFRS